MVALTYHIRPAGNQAFEADSRCLLIQAGIGVLSILLWDKNRSKPEAIEVFSGISTWDEDWLLMNQQSELLGYRSLETIVFLNFPRFLPVPTPFYNPGDAVEQLDAFFGQERFLHTGGDIIPALDMVLAWQVPNDIYDCIAGHFDVVRFKSLATLMLQNRPEMQVESVSGQLLVSGKMIWLAVWRSGQLLVIKSISADDPDILTYQMLNICRQWGIANNQIHWKVSGMVNQDSPLWNAAGRFFENVEPASTTVAFGSDTPPHFFAHLIQFLQKPTEL